MLRFVRRLLPLVGLMLLIGCNRPAERTHVPSASPPRWEGLVTTPDSVQLFTRLVGAGPDTVVIIHGGPGFTMDYLAADLEPLADRHTLLFYDQRGAGRSTLVSDSTGLAAQRFVDDLEALRARFGLRQLTLLGHSWGAGVAALYAARHPASVKQLLIVDGVPLRLSELVAGFETMNRARDSSERGAMQRWMETRRAHPEDASACHNYYRLWFRPFFADPTSLERSRGDFCAGTSDSRRNKLFAVDRFTMASLGAYDWRASLKSFPSRTLVIHGTVDPIPLSSAEEWAATLPNARLLALPSVGHFPYLEAPEPFFNAVNSFLAGNWPPDARRVTAPR